MLNIKQKLDNALYSYEPTEFFPVWYEGKLTNRAEFAIYKAGKWAAAFKRASLHGMHNTVTVTGLVITHIAENGGK